jgi:hypothetical protein
MDDVPNNGGAIQVSTSEVYIYVAAAMIVLVNGMTHLDKKLT